MHGEDDRDAVLFRRIDNGSGQHAVEEVDVDDIRLFLFNQRRNFFLCFKGIHHAEGGFQLLRGSQLPVKLHIADEIRALFAGQVLFILHGEKDNLVPRLPQQLRQTEKVGFRPAVHIKVFVYKQYLHAAPPYLRRSLRTAFRSGLYSPTATSACVTRSFMPFSCTIY